MQGIEFHRRGDKLQEIRVHTHIGPRVKSHIAQTATGRGNVQLGQHCRYLGIHIVAGRVFACSLDHAKRSFYRAFNAVYCKVGGVASEDVVLHLVKSKCMPLLLYGTEAMSLKKAQNKVSGIRCSKLLYESI